LVRLLTAQGRIAAAAAVRVSDASVIEWYGKGVTTASRGFYVAQIAVEGRVYRAPLVIEQR
jgi:hypothetical protein